MAGRFLIHMMELRPDAPVMNGSIFVDMTRMVKDAEEQEKLRRSSAMNDRVVAKSIEAIQEGLSEVDLAEKVNEFFAAEGASSQKPMHRGLRQILRHPAPRSV